MSKDKYSLFTEAGSGNQVLDEDVVSHTPGESFESRLRTAAAHLSKSRVVGYSEEFTPAIIIKTEKISVSQISPAHDKVLSSLRIVSKDEDSDTTNSITLSRHYAIVAGQGSHVNPAKLPAEMLTIVYEVGESEDGTDMQTNRSCVVRMLGPNYGIVRSQKASGLPYVKGEKPPKPKDKPKTEDKFKKKQSNKLKDASKGVPKPSPKNTTPGKSLADAIKEKPDIKETEFLIVGDSIAAGMTIAAVGQGIINYPHCRGKNLYYQCKTSVALSGATTAQILRRLKAHFGKTTLTTSGKKKVMIVSAGTNDALGQSGWGKHARGGYGKNRNTSFTADLAKKNIDAIVALGIKSGYEVRVMLVNLPWNGSKTRKVNTKNDFDNQSKIDHYGRFTTEVNNHISSKYSTFSFAGSTPQVEMMDHIHPSIKGSSQLITKAIMI